MSNYYNSFLEDIAEDLADKIVRRYKRHNVFFEIKDKHIDILGDCFRYKVKPKGKTLVSDIEKLADDVRRSLKLELLELKKEDVNVFIVAAKEVNRDNSLSRIMGSPECMEATKNMGLAHPLGLDNAGSPVIADIVKYPQLVIGGSTRSGKTMALQILLLAAVIQYRPDTLRLLICDRAGDLDLFNGTPHLLSPVIQTPDSFLSAIIQLKSEMERRVPLKRSEEFAKFPSILFAVDEFTSFISDMVDKEKRELATTTLLEILRRGRHAKIHMVLAVHDPVQRKMLIDLSDIPAKMAFRVSGSHNSRTLLGTGGAEKLKGMGDMKFHSPDSNGHQHLQGAFISEDELESVLNVIRRRYEKRSPEEKEREHIFNAQYGFSIDATVLPELDSEESVYSSVKKTMTTKQDANDKLLAEIVLWTLGREEVSINMIMEKCNIGWPRAKRFVDKLHEWAVVGHKYEKLSRVVLSADIDDLSHEAIDFMIRQGYSKDDIRVSLNSKSSGTTQSGSKSQDD